MEVSKLSEKYEVRRLGKGDIDLIFELSRGNKLFYEYHPPFVTHASILQDMEELPPGKTDADKYYVGFFEGSRLVALMDLILAYPDEQTAYIGLFMVDAAFQGQGIGSAVIDGCISCLTEYGYTRLALAIDRGNPQSKTFWRKNGFVPEGESKAELTYIPMERAI